MIEQEDAIYRIIGNAIRQLRKQSKITQQEMADHLGIQRTSVVNIEYGRQHTTLHNLYMIATLFKVPMHALFQETPSPLGGQEYAKENMKLRLEIIRQREQLTKIRHILEQYSNEEMSE
jgi:putative transcriptional regulator